MHASQAGRQTGQRAKLSLSAEQAKFDIRLAGSSDKGISGGTTARSGYQSMLAAARRGEFDVIVAEDASRLWRNMAE